MILLGLIALFPRSGYSARVLMLQGGGLQTATFLGILDGVESSGKAPDYVISACGGSLALALAGSFPTNKERLEFLSSREYYEGLKALKLTQYRYLHNSLFLIASTWVEGLAGSPPDLFGTYIMRIPQIITPKLQNSFPTSGTRYVMLGGKILIDPKEFDSAPSTKKRFQEVYFTDPETAERLRGFPSPLSTFRGRRTTIASETEAITGVDLISAARASISDPLLMVPAKIGDQRYVTGAIDLYPLEMARHLGDEIITSFNSYFNTMVDGPIYEATFGFDQNARLRAITSSTADYWVDLSDSDEEYETIGFNPALSAHELAIASRIPETYEDYVLLVEAQWVYGRSRVTEALNRPKRNDKSHIRNMNQHNSYESLRKEYGKDR